MYFEFPAAKLLSSHKSQTAERSAIFLFRPTAFPRSSRWANSYLVPRILSLAPFDWTELLLMSIDGLLHPGQRKSSQCNSASYYFMQFYMFFQLSFNQLSFQVFGFRLLFVQMYLRVRNQIFERDYFHKGIRNRNGLFTVTTVTNTVFIGKQSTTAV